jgi:hypothetical protein
MRCTGTKARGAIRPRENIFSKAVTDDSKCDTASVQVGDECHDLVVWMRKGRGLFPRALLTDLLNGSISTVPTSVCETSISDQ